LGRTSGETQTHAKINVIPHQPDLLREAAERALAYIEALPSRRVSAAPEAVAALEGLREPLPESPSDPVQTLRLLDRLGSPATMATAGPRFFGLVAGGALPVTLASTWLAAAWDQPASFFRLTPASALLEEIALGWIIELLKMPPTCAGAFVTGATLANTVSLAAARHRLLEGAGWNAEADGLFGAPPLTVIVGEQAHASIFKALGLLGLGRSRVIRVPADSEGRMRPEALPHLTGPSIVCVQAGNVNSGAFDPIGEICRLVHPHGGWVHVDGAFGLWAAATPSRSHLTAGLQEADSWATDGHKWLNVPYDSGLALVRDPVALQAAMAITADYLPQETPERNPSDFTPEMSRRSRGVEIWAALRSLGREGVAEMIEHTCRHAIRFAEGLAAAGYEILNEVVLNQVLVSWGDTATTEKVIDAIQTDGTCWCSGTTWRGRPAMRISVSSWATTEADVERSLAAMIRAAEGRA